MSDLLHQFRSQWTARFPHLSGKRMLLAVSGGADSMAMATLFFDSGLPFGVAHCNFGLRGEASDLDEQLVRNWCLQQGIQFHTIKFDTKANAAEWKTGTQETARILRYDWFEAIRVEFGYARIVTAHHANDNVETLLINLFKGTGISGLHGILPENGHIIRPLLFATRDELMAYVTANNIAYREDESNKTDDYLRNAVRHNIVPVVQGLFPGAVNHVNDSIARFAEAEQLYRRAMEAEKKKLIEQRGKDLYIPVLKLRKREPLATICYELLLPYGFTPAQVPQVLALMNADTGHYVASATHRVIRSRDFLVITTLEPIGTDIITIEAAPAEVDTGAGRFTFSIKDVPGEIPADANKAFIPLDAVTFPLILRKWRTGDYFYPLGMGMKKKKVSRLLIDQKVPLHEKERVYVLECNKRIMWVAGIRLDERFRVKTSTGKVLVVSRSAT